MATLSKAEKALIITVAVLITIGAILMSFPPALGEFTPQELQIMLHISNILYQILEEEKKQTTLLDHIDCHETTTIINFKAAIEQCGPPLNITGIHKP